MALEIQHEKLCNGLFSTSESWGSHSRMAEKKWEARPFLFYLLHWFIVLYLLIFFTHPVSSQEWDGVIVTQADFQALQAFKQELIDPLGFLKSWNDSGFGACSGGWEGIKCSLGQVIVIQLPWRGLSGKITSKIGQLQLLRKLSLHDNLIGGPIPPSLGLIPNLRGLQLYNNRFSGSIPPSLGYCHLLQALDLGNNSLDGVIPENLASLPNLFRLNASFNRLTGSIPANLFSSSSLIYLALESNNLSGSLPASHGNSSKLQVVTLSNNHINGTLPNEIGMHSLLRTVDVSGNALTGNLPIGLTNLSLLELLNLGENKLDGPIPETVGNLSSLKELVLSYNNFSGAIPDSLGNLGNLSSFDVSYNNLSGSVPESLARKFNSSSFVGNLQLCGFPEGPQCVQAPSPSVSAPVPSPTKKSHLKLNTKEIILIAAGALLLVLVLLCLLLCCLARKRKAAKPRDSKLHTTEKAEKKTHSGTGAAETGEAGGRLVHFDGPMVFTADDLLCATAEIMGKSTYGTVYKATLEDGSQVAVKRLRERITKGQNDFETEVNVLGKIRHPNLLALRAYYMGPKGEKLLVFDYMPKGSLATFLHARGPETSIDWTTRMRIIKGIARGLLHLHDNENMSHGNLTSSNVLLDEQTNAKIGDYGLPKLMKPAANTNVIATAGALGYRAPELSKLKKANTKTDVYSLGVIILELLTGKSPGEVVNGVDLPQMVASVVKEEWTNEVFDLELMKDASAISDELLNTLKLALHCVDPTPSARPEVQQIVQQLEEIRPEDAIPEPGSSGVQGDDDAATAPAE